MKRKVLLNALILVIAGLSINFSSKAQVYVLSTAPGQSIDTVSTGGRYAYKVTPDATIAAMVPSVMNPSVFQWVFTPGLTVLKEDGSGNATVVPTEPGYVSESAVSAVMPAPALISLSVNEKSQPLSGTGCAGAATTLQIRVVPRATINFTGTQSNGGCAAANYSLPLTLTGYGPWTIEYSITGPTSTDNYTIALANAANVGNANQTVGVAGITTLTLDITAAQMNQGTGTYDVKILNIYDRFMLKSLSALTSLVADLPTTNSFKLYVYPTPAAPTIQHQKNL